MTTFRNPAKSPALHITRVIVDGALTLDLQLHSGLNVINTVSTDPQHSNKAGKTGLVELIQYGLGRQVKKRKSFHFAPIQDQIDTLWLELICNKRRFTVRRSLKQHTAGVVVFPVQFTRELRGASGESIELGAFSDFILSQLGIPRLEVSLADGRMTPLSLPLLMRAFVLHQDDSFSEILDRVEPDERRGQILGLLTGARSPGAYELERKRGAAITRATMLQRSYEAIGGFLVRHGVSNAADLEQQERDAAQALESAIRARQSAQEALRTPGVQADVPLGKGRTDEMRSSLLLTQSRRSELERQLLGFRQESERLGALISSLQADQAKSGRLRASEVVLSSFAFQVCPRCTQEVTGDMRAREEAHRCSLCSRPLIVTSDAVPKAAPAAEEIAQQLAEAEAMRAEASRDYESTAIALGELREQEVTLSKELDRETAVYVSPALDELASLNHIITEKAAVLAEIRKVVRQAKALDDLHRDMVAAQAVAADADAELRSAQSEQKKRHRELEAMYLKVLTDLDFPDVDRVSIDPTTLMPDLDGFLYVHRGAALRGLAVVAYHLAVLRLSLNYGTFFPRLLVIDSPAVGDLNEVNHTRLLEYLAEIQNGAWASDSAKLPLWQIILTTRRTVPALRPSVRMRLRAVQGEMLLRPAVTADDSRDEPPKRVGKS